MSWQITEISPCKRKKSRSNIYSHDGWMLSLYDETILRHGLKAGAMIEENQQEALRREDTLQYAKELCGSYLSYCARSRDQLWKHLLSHGVDEKSAEEAIAVMESYGYIDDEAYAKGIVAGYESKLGKTAIKRKLAEKGIPKEVIEEMEFCGETEKEAAGALAEKLMTRYADVPAQKRRARIYAALIRKGFSYELASELCRDGEGDGE